MKSIKIKLLLLIVVIFAVWGVNHFNLSSYLTLTYLKTHSNDFQDYTQDNYFLASTIYMGIYILTTALSLPGATILTLAGGALFGFGKGLLLVSFSSTLGATIAFLAARFFLKDYVQNKFGDKLKTINKGIEREGAFYLFSLRLIPVFPFFLINLVMGLTPIKTITFYIVSQIGMLPGTAAYVYAGLKLSELESLGGIISQEMLLAFCFLGLTPLVSKFLLNKIKATKVYKPFKKPKKFDYNLVAIGAGSAGLVTTYIGAAVRAKVALIEKHKMGGDCLNTGCVPSKALLKTAQIVHSQKKAHLYGLESIDIEFDFASVMQRVQKVIKKIEPHDSVERYEGLGVECIQGAAKILSPWEIEVNGKTITTKNIVVATGASPFVPPIRGLKEIDFLVSDNLWSLRKLPKKLVVLGGGPIGIEMAQAFNRLGSKVTVVEMADRILAKEDQDVSALLSERLTKEGIDLRVQTRAIRIEKKESETNLVVDNQGDEGHIPFDKILVAVGRKANTKGFGLEDIGVKLRDNGAIEVNEYMQTNFPNIYACGDVAGNFQLTHTASHEAWYASVNALFSPFKKFRADYSAIPWATYTEPTVATVGKNEEALKKEGISYEVYKYGIDDLDRAIADDEDYGFVKVMLKPNTDKILGATIVGAKADDLLIEFTSAMKNKLGLNKILSTIHPYPTMSEANKYLAGVWKNQTKPEKLLSWVKRFHQWRRG